MDFSEFKQKINNKKKNAPMSANPNINNRKVTKNTNNTNNNVKNKKKKSDNVIDFQTFINI